MGPGTCSPRRPSWPPRGLGAATTTLVAALAVTAPSASAGTVGTGPGDAVGFTAGASEANRVTLTTMGDRLIVADAGVVSMTALGACTTVDPQTASCPATTQTRITVRGGDLDDVITNASAVGGELLGGDGHDVLRGGVAAEQLDGEAGPDELDGGPGDDTFAPGPGPPVADADTIGGGPGFDAVSYGARAIAVTVSKDGAADDGAVGEGDNVGLDVERVAGSTAGDRLLGSAAPDALDGGPGADALDGAAGDDAVGGGPGADTLAGGPGADDIRGGPDRDVVIYGSTAGVTVRLDAGTALGGEPGDADRLLEVEDASGGRWGDTLSGSMTQNALAGGQGEDYVNGGGGVDRLDGGPSPDVVDSRDGGRDEPVSCGPGVDFAIVDRRDRVARSGPNRCERVDDGSRTRPRPGWVYVEPSRCPASGPGVEVGLPVMHRLVPLRSPILLATGYRGRRPPKLAATGCAVRVTATPASGRRAAADVSGAAATVRQSSGRRVTTTLTVGRPSCSSGTRARAAQSRGRRLRVKTSRRRGRWAVNGKYSRAAAIGTDWTTLESCSRTVTIVRRGRVRVYDVAKRRTVTVRAGRRYVAQRRTSG